MKKTISTFITCLLLLPSLLAEEPGQKSGITPCPGMPTITDQDGNVYNTVQIGRQCWMRENLRVTKYSNGDPIISGLDNMAWGNATEGAFSIFDINFWAASGITSEEEMAEAYGKLYNWHAVNDPRGLCPPGMHVPSLAELQQLIAFVDGAHDIKGNKLKSCRQDESPLGDTCQTYIHPYWANDDTHFGTDDYGFSGLPAGWRDTDGSYNGLTKYGFWWSSDEHDDIFSWYLQLEWHLGSAAIIGYYKSLGLSIRCLENLVVPSVTTDEATVSSALKVIGGGEVHDPGISDVTARGVVWGKEMFPDLDNNEGFTVDGVGLGMFLSEITNFDYNTTYYVRAYATNSEGTGYGNQVAFYVVTNSPCQGIPTVTDIDGNVYNTVQIGDQCWLKENLKTTKYSNGASIVYPGNDNTQWQNNTNGAYAWYDNDLTNKGKYGALYNWYAVDNTQGLCPAGWRVPAHHDWTKLTSFVGGMGSPFGSHLKSCRQDESPLGGDCDTQEHPRWNKSSAFYGTDIHGFSALPGGLRQRSGQYDFMGNSGSWWTNTLSSDESAWNRQLSSQNDEVYQYGPGSFDAGFSVRCIQDPGSEPGVYNVTLNLNMSYASNFNPETDHVYITGTFSGFWPIPGSDPDNQLMTRVGETMTWTKTFYLEEGDYEYKYFRNEGWDGGEWDSEPNREITVADDMVINDLWGYLAFDDIINVSTLAGLRTMPPGETLYRYTGEAVIVAMPGQSVVVPYIYSDFEAHSNVTFAGWPHSPIVVENPDPSGINTSTHVAQWQRSEFELSHVFAELDGKIDFSDQHIFRFKIWSPIACDVVFKVEDKTDYNIAFEVSQVVSDTEQWVELTYDLSGAESGKYDKIVIFMDILSTEDNVFYFDDVSGPAYEGAVKAGSYAVNAGATDKGLNRSHKFIQDETAAIFIFDAPGNISTSYNLYDVITNVTGQIEVLNNMVRFLPTQNTPEALGNIPMEPVIYRLDVVTPDDQAKLIKFNHVTFEGVEAGEVFAGGQNYTITDGVNTFVLSTLFWDEDYIGMEIPHGSVNITGVLTQFYDDMQITPRFAADIEDSSEPEWHPCPGIPTVTDIDGNVYTTVLIGDQCWIRENLRTTNYRDGTPIEFPDADNEAWENNTTGAYAWHNNDIDWKEIYGALYNWYAVDNVNGLCPTGWKEPTDKDLTQLVNYVVSEGFPNVHDNQSGAGSALKSCRQVDSPLGGECNTVEHPRWNTDVLHYGLDAFGLSALPGGYRFSSTGYSHVGEITYWWSATEHTSTNALCWGIRSFTGDMGVWGYGKNYGFSVRCFREYDPSTTYNLNLEVNPLGAGSVTGVGEHENGIQVSISATANTGWEFVNWTGHTEYVDDANSAHTTVMMPASDISLTANFVETGIPENLLLSNETITNGNIECYDALQTITVSDFTVEAGGSATFIAGQSIHLLPGTTVLQGGYLLARIAANENDFCGIAKAIEIVEETYLLEEDMVSADLPLVVLETDLFKVYPNPTTGEFTLELQDFEQLSTGIVEIYSMQGHLVTRKELPPQQQHTLSLFQQQPGVYLLRVVKNHKTGSVKIIRR